MKKKLIALFAVCSMITTVAAGMVQTAYADADPISIVVSDGATDNEKVLTFYYEPESIVMIEGYLTFDNANVEVTSGTINLTYPAGMGDKNAAMYDSTQYQLLVTTYSDDAMTSADKKFATVTVSVPGDVDVEASFRIECMYDGNWEDCGTPTLTATIPANATTPSAPITVDNVDVNAVDIPGTYEHAAERADVYGVQVTVNEGDVVTGIKVAADDTHYGELNFGTKVSAGPIQFAVIFANESGIAQLPTLTSEMITAITE